MKHRARGGGREVTLPAQPSLPVPRSKPTTCRPQSHPKAGASTDQDCSVLAQISRGGLGLAACMVTSGSPCLTSLAYACSSICLHLDTAMDRPRGEARWNIQATGCAWWSAALAITIQPTSPVRLWRIISL